MLPSFRAVAVVLAVGIAACNDNGPSARAAGTAHFLNGATPRPAGASVVALATTAPGNGIWQLSPDKITLTLKKISFLRGNDPSTGSVSDVNCVIAYDKAKPGLTELTDCAFSLNAGTYTSVSLTFADAYQLYINDSVHGFFTTSTGIVTTAPAGGAQNYSFAVPGASNGEFSPSPIPLPTPLVVGDSTPVTVSVVVNGLQFFWATVNGGTVSTTGTTSPQRPDFVATVGGLAAVEVYSHSAIGTGDSFCAFNCTTSTPNGPMSVSVYYLNATTPGMVGLNWNGYPPNCPLTFAPGFLATPRAYIGLDASGNLGWALGSDLSFTTYTGEMRMTRVATVSGTTQLYCKTRSTDPAPPGGSYASGAPAIDVAGNLTGTYVLVAK